MRRRRELMAMQKTVLDTTPVIFASDKRWYRGNLVDELNISATIVYTYEPYDQTQYIQYSDLFGVINIFKDGAYIDYWSPGNYKLNVNSNGIAVNIPSNKIDISYLYIERTGQILFAGKNTPYYGHTNISELE